MFAQMLNRKVASIFTSSMKKHLILLCQEVSLIPIYCVVPLLEYMTLMTT